MKTNTLFLLGIFCMLVSCRENNGKTDVEANNPATDVKAPVTSLQQTVARVEGTWISDGYIAAIEKNKKIYGNPNYATSVFGFSIIKDSLSDGEDYLYGFSKHDAGYTWPIRYNPETSRVEYDRERDDGNSPPSPFFIRPGSDTILELVYPDTKNVERYRKADLDVLLSEILFAGNYIDKQTGKQVTFTSDGKVSGIAGKTSYLVQYDEEGEYAVPFDAIVFYANNEDEAGETYHFKISGDSIRLYTVNSHEITKYADYSYTIGALAYTLAKS